MAEAHTGRTVLLIDDESNIRKVTRLRLEVEGYTVLTAARGEVGLSLAKMERPDVILLDVLMPHMDGREVLRRLKADPETQDIPVVMLTVVGTEDELFEPIGPGAVVHVTKPYESEDLVQKVKQVLSEHPQH